MLFWLLSVALFAQAGQETSAAHYSAELIFPLHAAHNHAPGIVELPNGDLLATWYRGSGEHPADDVAVYAAQDKGGRFVGRTFSHGRHTGFSRL